MSESVGPIGFEHGAILALTGPNHRTEDRELELVVAIEVGLWSSDLVLLVEDCSANDGNRIRRGSVITAHLLVELADCTVQGDITVLLVHVVVACPRLIAKYDAKCFHVVGPALKDLID